MSDTTHLEQFYNLVPEAIKQVYQAGEPTPLEPLDGKPRDYEVFLKREDLGPIKAYKWRGGFNAVLNYHRETGCETVVAASAGNHAQGVALAAQMLGIQAKIFMPLSAPLMKQEAVKHHGGEHVELILSGDDYNEAGTAAKSYVQETGHTYIHPFDDLYTMAGQTTIAEEIIHSNQGPFDYAFLQIGGGGMAGAVAAWLKKHWPTIKIIGVEGIDQASMKASIESGAPITLDSVDAFCDGTAVTRPGDVTFDICAQVIDGFITVSNEEVSAAIQQLWEAKRVIPEPSGAMGLAGLNQYGETHGKELQGKKILCVICGANMDFNKLSLIAAKSAIGAHKRRYYRVELPEKNGALLEILESHFKDLNVSEFMYGKTHETQAWQTIAIDASAEEFDALEANLNKAKIQFSDISLDADIRYRVINYNPALFHNPLFMTVRFPERKGALRDFLRDISKLANICYFNYAYSGESIGRALMGFEFEHLKDQEAFKKLTRHSVVTCLPIEPETVERILEHGKASKSS
ncbi:MAG: pyridoxal-phosphate dependent enzyme [Alphaproteobacteria bacterium]|nr:pyridoxal-phosphate dependent enzyme [Alphaproteobacteria bacterium]